jgi:hypothetical protein
VSAACQLKFLDSRAGIIDESSGDRDASTDRALLAAPHGEWHEKISSDTKLYEAAELRG